MDFNNQKVFSYTSSFDGLVLKETPKLRLNLEFKKRFVFIHLWCNKWYIRIRIYFHNQGCCLSLGHHPNRSHCVQYFQQPLFRFYYPGSFRDVKIGYLWWDFITLCKSTARPYSWDISLYINLSWAKNYNKTKYCLVTLFWRNLSLPVFHMPTRARTRTRTTRRRPTQLVVNPNVNEDAMFVSPNSLSIVSCLIFPGWARKLGLEAYARQVENSFAFLLTKEKCSEPIEILKRYFPSNFIWVTSTLVHFWTGGA